MAISLRTRFRLARLVEGVDVIPGLRFGLFTISQTGVLVYRSGSGGNVDLAWFDRVGKRLGTLGPPGAYNNPALSPDEKRLAVSIIDPVARVTVACPGRGITTTTSPMTASAS